MEQIVDLQNDADFQALGVDVVSIAFDSPAEQRAGAQQYGIDSVPLLTDTEQAVSEAYTVLQWAAATGEPSHTFVLVDAEGQIAWLQDYGSPANRGVMYVPVEELTMEVSRALSE